MSEAIPSTTEQTAIGEGLRWDEQRGELLRVDFAAGRVFRDRVADDGSLNPIGTPDGLTVDAEGDVWVAIWGGGRIHRYSPAGELRGVLAVPAVETTSCAFAGPGLHRLYVTTATEDWTDDERRADECRTRLPIRHRCDRTPGRAVPPRPSLVERRHRRPMTSVDARDLYIESRGKEAMDPAEGTIDRQFSSPDAVATPWSRARQQLESAKTYWVTTVRPDGRPHSTTIAAVWLDDAIHFTTGASEMKAKNLAGNRKVIVTAGCSDWEGLDIVIEGEAVSVTDPDRLTRLATAFTEKYDDFFGMRVVGGKLGGAGTDQAPLAFEVQPTKAFGFGKAPTFSQTRWLWR